MIYTNKMVFEKTMPNHRKPFKAHLYDNLFGRGTFQVFVDGGAAINMLLLKQMKTFCRTEEDF